MTATFKRIDANKNTPTRRTLQGRIRLRLLPIFGLLLLLAATPSVLLPQIREREQLSIQRVDVSSGLGRGGQRQRPSHPQHQLPPADGR
ncbi:MAG: hypothetical protein MUC99_03850 [Anaerolineae bacterium]|nr:hypothetical protein [Anaerolineae bacterium]